MAASRWLETAPSSEAIEIGDLIGRLAAPINGAIGTEEGRFGGPSDELAGSNGVVHRSAVPRDPAGACTPPASEATVRFATA